MTEAPPAVSTEAIDLAIEKYRAIFGTPGEYDGPIYTDDLPRWAYDFLGFDVCNLIVALEQLRNARRTDA
jgi:hypothetical protein